MGRCRSSGSLCYGYPSNEIDQDISPLKPALSLHCRPLYIKRMLKGDSVGYGRIFELDRDRNIMTLPVGYADGVARRLGPHLSVSIAKALSHRRSYLYGHDDG